MRKLIILVLILGSISASAFELKYTKTLGSSYCFLVLLYASEKQIGEVFLARFLSGLAWLFCFAAQCTAKSKIQTGVDEDIGSARRFGKYERKLEWTNKVSDCCCSTFISHRLH